MSFLMLAGGGGVASWKGWKDTSDEWKSKSFNDTWKVNDNWKASGVKVKFHGPVGFVM